MFSRSNLVRIPAAAALIAGLGATLPTAAQAQDTTASRSITRVQSDTRIEKLADLHFGDIIPGAAGGTITLNVNGNVSTTGTVVAAGAGFLQIIRFTTALPEPTLSC